MAGNYYGWNIDSTQEFLENEGDNIKMPVPLETAEETSSSDSSESNSNSDSDSDSNSNPNPCVKGYYWCVSTGEIPSQAVKSGVDADGGDIYIGRAIHEGELQPAKIIPNHGCAYIAFSGEEVRKDDYEILCRGSCTVIWQECQDGMVPYNAVAGGCTAENEKLYIGRVFYNGTHTPGKIQPSHNTCYVPYGGEELSFSNYEALVLQ